MTSPDRLVRVAIAEVGYIEKATNYMLDSKTANAGNANFTKYARDTYPQYQGQAWCAMFVSWCAAQSEATELMPRYASCADGIAQFRARSRWHDRGYLPEKGDIIFFTNARGIPCHTGIVAAFADGKVYTIEGNTSSASGLVSNGGTVAIKAYRADYNRIYGYGSPDWDAQGDCSAILPILRKGDKVAAVKSLQTLLLAAGYDVGSTGADGSFGGKTDKAVKAYQHDHLMSETGVVDAKMWQSLILGG